MLAAHEKCSTVVFEREKVFRIDEDQFEPGQLYSMMIRFDDDDHEALKIPVRVIELSEPPGVFEHSKRKVDLVALDKDLMPLPDTEMSAGFSDGLLVDNDRESINAIGGFASSAYLTRVQTTTAVSDHSSEIVHDSLVFSSR